MKVYVKNMVCDRCRMAVESTLDELELRASSVSLGEIDFGGFYGNTLDPAVEGKLKGRLEALGFELLNDRQSRIVEKIKLACIQMIASSAGGKKQNLSDVLKGRLNREYNYLSNLFSSVEGITIEQFFIRQRIEKVKELLVYDELSLGEIAFQLGFSSVAHLSGQFKKITGMTPSHFRSLKSARRRKPLDRL